MRLEHTAIWTRDLERLRAFYERYFGAAPSPLYQSHTRIGFTSRFLTFPDKGARLELMSIADLSAAPAGAGVGYAHLAVAVGSRAAVDALTARMRDDGVHVVGLPRETGDGYYESVVKDPDGNMVEITV